MRNSSSCRVHHSSFPLCSSSFLPSLWTVRDLIAKRRQPQVDALDLFLINVRIGAPEESFIARERQRELAREIEVAADEIIDDGQIGLRLTEPLVFNQRGLVLLEFVERSGAVGIRRVVVGCD